MPTVACPGGVSYPRQIKGLCMFFDLYYISGILDFAILHLLFFTFLFQFSFQLRSSRVGNCSLCNFGGKLRSLRELRDSLRCIVHVTSDRQVRSRLDHIWRLLFNNRCREEGKEREGRMRARTRHRGTSNPSLRAKQTKRMDAPAGYREPKYYIGLRRT